MPAINADTADAWRQIASDCAAERPSVGKRVVVTRGKYKGKAGRVLKHQVSKFGAHYRYGSDASHHMMDLMGRLGWCVQIDADGDRFWTSADNVKCES